MIRETISMGALVILRWAPTATLAVVWLSSWRKIWLFIRSRPRSRMNAMAPWCGSPVASYRLRRDWEQSAVFYYPDWASQSLIRRLDGMGSSLSGLLGDLQLHWAHLREWRDPRPGWLQRVVLLYLDSVRVKASSRNCYPENMLTEVA